jgi:hypothetical protein
MVNESSIRKWKMVIDPDIDYDLAKTLHPGRKSSGEHIESDLCQFIDKLRDSETDVTVELVAFEAKRLDETFYHGFYSINRW